MASGCGHYRGLPAEAIWPAGPMSDDGTILIRNAESGEVEVGPIKTEQSAVHCLAYSPLGDRIASAGHNKTICVWDSKTGELVIGPITGLGSSVRSLVWSLDGTKIYSASDTLARVFDSASGAEIHHFEHDHYLCSVALSPQNNVLACVGHGGVAQLWDTETHQQLGQPFGWKDVLWDVKFSPDGRYLAYGGIDPEISLWLVNEIAPELAVGASTTIEDAAPEGTQPESPSSSYLDRDATNHRTLPGDHEWEWSDDPYKNFFWSSKTSLSLAPSDANSHPFYRRFLTIVNPFQHHPAETKSLPLKEKRHKRGFFPLHAKSPVRVPATTDSSERIVQEGEHVEESDCPGTSRSDARKKKGRKGKQREDSPIDAQTRSPDYPSPFAEDLEDEHDSSGPSRRHAPETESIPLQQIPKRSPFTRHSGPRPVTIYAGRPKMLRYTSRRAFRINDHSADKKTDAQTGQSSSDAAQSSFAAQHSRTLNQQQQQQEQEQEPQPQTTATHPAANAQHKDPNFGFWGNFRLRFAFCCIPDGTDIFAIS